jgi:hypothetical protein
MRVLYRQLTIDRYDTSEGESNGSLSMVTGKVSAIVKAAAVKAD